MAVVQTETRFPPFPAGPPPGVILIPFSEWDEMGILKTTSDNIERDALGIPTIRMPSRHDDDRPKTNSTQYVFVGKGPTGKAGKKGSNEGIDWLDSWPSLETQIHPGGYDPNKFIGVREAAQNFAQNRPWPKENQTSSAMSLRNLWDKFQVYIGVLENPTDHNKKTASHEDPDGDDDDDEFSDREGMENGVEFTAEPRADEHTDIFIPCTSGGEKLWSFCDDPEKAVTIFLSSYMNRQGLIYTENNLQAVPHLIRFFLVYLHKNTVFGSKGDLKILRALKIAEVAIKELPLTSRIAKVLPDGLNKGFLNCFEVRPDMFIPDPISFGVDPEANRSTELLEGPTKTAESNIWGTSAMAEWGSSDASAWDGTTDVSGTANRGAAWESNDNLENQPTLDSWISSPPPDWTPCDTPFLMPFLGPSTLPLTHRPGIIETSIRRITSITFPPTTLSPKSQLSITASADAVESELENTFVCVVLSNWDDGVLNVPTIHKLSKGAVLADGENGPVTGEGNLKPHNPWKDDITILVEKETAAPMSIGMGLGGSFVQIAREGDFAGESIAVKKPKKKTKRGDKRFWYVGGLTTTLTSYHMEMN